MIQLMKSVVSKIMYPLWHVAEEDEINLPRVPQMRNFMNSTVTILCQDYGLVDDMIYFTSEVVLGGIPLSVGHKVNVLAYQDRESRGWKALRVEKSFDDWEDNSASDCELSKAKALIGIVTSCNGEGGMINSSTCFSLSHVCEGFQPIKGDWVRAEYFINPSKWCSQACSVAPLRSRVIDKVQVSSICGRCGVLESSIFFTLDSLYVPNEYCPSTGDVVNAVVVESTQSFYCWRALAMTPVSSSSKGNLAKNEHVKMNSHLLLEDKGGLEVSKMTNFGSVLLGQTKEILVCIMNHSNQPHILISSGLAGWDRSGQFSLHVPVAHGYEGPVGNLSCPLSLLWRAHARGPYLLLLCSGSLYCGINGSSNTCVSYLSSAEGTWEISIAPGQEMTVAVQCQARTLGSCTELLLLHFQSFSIGRLLDVDVHASEELLVKAQTNYMPASQLSLLPSTQMIKDVIAVLPSSLPHKLPRRHLPNFLSRYPVPPSLKECFEHEKDVLFVQPQLAEPLSWCNFQCKFSALLWLEELQAEREVKEFSIHGTFLRKSANYLLLDVPGVADGRPSVCLGDKVILKRTLANGIELEYTAYISEIYNDELSLRVNLDFHSNYNGEPLDVEFTFNRLTMRRCHAALERVEHLGEAVLFPQCLVIKPVQLHLEWLQNNTEDETFPSDERDAGAQGVDMVSVGTQTQAGKSSQSTFPLSQNGFYFNPALNPHQRAAVKRILAGECRPLPYILFGPPGTGKTVTLLEAILQIHHKLPDSRILVCTPSNSAADLLCSRLHYSGHVPPGNLVRVNASFRLEESIPEEVKSYSHSGEDIFQAAHYRIVISTCSSAGMFYQVGLRVGHFTHVFIDEAGQAMEPECFIPLALLSEVDGQIVLAGDPMQLGPLVKSILANVYGLSKSLLERLMSMPLYSRQEKEFGPHSAYNPLLVTKLLINYRSHQAILHLPSRLFYNQELELGSDPKVVESLQNWRGLPTRGFPLMFHGVRGREMREGNSPSWFNPVEAVQVLIYCCQLTRRLYKPVSPFDIGIITPYRKQVEKIRLLLGRAGLLDIKVGSVEEFQGREFLVIIISLVRSNEEILDQGVHSLLGFISNPKRFNVAITRAKALLIVLGNPHVLIKDPCFAELLQYCEENGAFFGCNLPAELISQS